MMIANVTKIVDTDGYPLIDMADYWIIKNSHVEYILDEVSAINEYLADHGIYDSDNQNLVGAEMVLLQNFEVQRGRWIANENQFGSMPWNEKDNLEESLNQEEFK